LFPAFQPEFVIADTFVVAKLLILLGEVNTILLSCGRTGYSVLKSRYWSPTLGRSARIPVEGVCVGKKPDIVWEVRCWKNRKVILYRRTLLDHVLRFHFDEAFVVDALKRNFSKPICVIDNKKHGTENAIYNIQPGQHRWLLVAIQFVGFTGKLAQKTSFIKTFYGVSEIPGGRVLWGTKP
jgi:hypothetical protein